MHKGKQSGNVKSKGEDCMPEEKKQRKTPHSEEYHWEKNEKDAGNNQWTSQNSTKAFTDDRECRGGPGGEEEQ